VTPVSSDAVTPVSIDAVPPQFFVCERLICTIFVTGPVCLSPSWRACPGKLLQPVTRGIECSALKKGRTASLTRPHILKSENG
jgi:hypothetical protein